MGFSAALHERTSSGKVLAKQFLSQYSDLVLEDSRKECGLVDDAGNAKNSHALWRLWIRLPTVKRD